MAGHCKVRNFQGIYFLFCQQLVCSSSTLYCNLLARNLPKLTDYRFFLIPEQSFFFFFFFFFAWDLYSLFFVQGVFMSSLKKSSPPKVSIPTPIAQGGTNYSIPTQEQHQQQIKTNYVFRAYFSYLYIVKWLFLSTRAGKIRCTLVLSAYRAPEVVSRKTKYCVPKIFKSSYMSLL